MHDLTYAMLLRRAKAAKATVCLRQTDPKRSDAARDRMRKHLIAALERKL